MKNAFLALAGFAAASVALGQQVKPGAIVEFVRPHPRTGSTGCIIASGFNDGDAVVIQAPPCETANIANRRWIVPGGSGASTLGPPTQIRIFGTKCLDVREGANADGTRLQVWECANGNPNQLFNINDFDQSVRWAGSDKCLDLAGGVTTTGNPIQLWTCFNQNPNQYWYSDIRSEPFLRAPVNEPVLWQSGIIGANFAPCLMAESNADGAAVITQLCHLGTPESRQWTAPLGGATSNTGLQGPITQIRIFGDKCLDVPSGNPNDGTKLQIWTCADGNPNQLWRINDDATITWAGRNSCVDLTDGQYVNPERAQIWTCSPQNINQGWGAIRPT